MEISAEPFVAFESEKGHYTADACVVWCYDDRFYKLLKAFGKQEKFGHIDLVKVAGGAKALASAEVSSTDRDFVLDQIKKSAMLHGTKRVILMLHRDCGGYGGSAQFANADEERDFFADQLQRARDFTNGQMPDMRVDAYFADFDGLYKS
jgi:carbonic anhydrase